MRYKIYLAGYGNQLPARLMERIEAGAGEHCLVLDVRARRMSWCRAYTGPGTERVFKAGGHDYIWLHELGSLYHKSGVRLVNEPAGMMALEAQIKKSQVPVVLLCAELLSKDCHRRVIAEKLAGRLAGQGHELEVVPI